MLKYITSLLLLVFTFVEVQGQQDVFSRDNVTTGNWGDGQLPWFYATSNNNQGDPDNNNSIPNFIRIGHNSNLNMTLNGRSYRARWLIFEAGATSPRTIGGDILDLRPNNGDCKIENLSIGLHTFNNSVALFASTEINPIDGDLTFNNGIFNNGNFIDVFGNNGNELLINGVISGTGGLAIKQNSVVRFTGDQTYTGGTFVEAGTLSLDGVASTNTIASDITISGGDLEYGNASDEQINNNSNLTLSSGSWTIGARIETINSLNMTGGSVNLASGQLAANSTSSIENANINITAASGSIIFNNLLQMGGATIDYSAATSGTNLFRITSGLTTTSGTTSFTNSTIGFTSALINLDGSNQTLTILSGADLDIEWIFTNGGLTKIGEGSLILRANSTYNDPTVVEEGAIIYETNNAIDDDSDLVLNGGSLNTNGFSDDLADLDVNSNSTISLGAGSHILQFQNSSAVSWDGSAILTIENWQGTPGASGSEGRIFIGNDDTGLTPAQLAQISFDNYPSPAELLPTGELVPSALDVTIFDNFNRGDNNVVGIPSSGGANWIETEGAATGARILNSALRLQRGASGRDFVSYDMSALYETAFDGSITNTEWRFNMTSDRSTPSGFGSGNYGMAYILGSNESDFLSADAFGYAVVIGGTGADPVRLVKFSDGLDLNSNLTTVASVPGNPANSYFSIVVTYESCSNTWSLTARDDGGSFANPTTGNFPAAITGVDNEYTSNDLDFMGALWNHGSAGSSFAEFDNFYVPNTSFDTEYTWSGSVDSDYQDPANWTPARVCPRGRDRLVFNGSGNVDVTNVPDQEQIGQWILGPSIELRVEDDPNTGSEPDVPSILIMTGGVGEDFIIPTGATMRFDCGSSFPPDALQFELERTTTADIDGTLVFQRTNSGSGPDHRITAADPSAIDIEGTIIAEDLGSGWEPFGESGSPGSVIFQSGAVYDGSEGGSPFGDSGQPAQSIFNSGSTYIHRGNHSFQTGDRIYAHFEYRNPEINPQTLLFGSNNIWTMEDFRILDGTLILSGGTNNLAFNINVSGDFEVGVDGALNYEPVGALPGSGSTFTFNGSSPQIMAVVGPLVFNDRVTLEVDNDYASPGFALQIQDDFELFNDLIITDGEVQGDGATITMSGVNTSLIVEDNASIFGTGVGAGQDLSLVSNDPLLTFSGGTSSTCRFFSLIINDNLEFVLDRPRLEVQFGSFTLGDNSILRINTPGEAILGTSAGPLYGLNSQLIYNSGAATERGAEWSSTSGAGYPVNVTIQNGTTIEVTNSVTADYGIQGDLNIGSASNGAGTLTMTDVTNFLQVGGDVNIGDGAAAGTLTLSSQVGGDIRLRGDWNNAGTFNSNDRAIFFNGSTEQIINTTSGAVEVMDYLIIDNSSAQGVLLGGSFTELEVRGTPGNNALEIYDGDLNLNGKSLYLGRNGNATGVIIGSEPIEIFSATPTFFNFEGTGSKVISSPLGGSLEFDDQITVTISSGVDFGSSLTTINATLELQGGAFVNSNAPIYGPNGVLVYNTGGNYDRRVEWDGTNGNPGYPNDVIIRNGTFVSAAANAGFAGIPLELRRNLTIENGGTLFMDFSGNGMTMPLVVGGDLNLDGLLQGSDRVGGDIYISGNWNQESSGVYTPNDRQVRFEGTTPQTIDAPINLEFAFVEVDNPSSVSIINDIQVTDVFDFTDGIVTPDSDDLDGTEKIIFTAGSSVGAISNDSHYQGIVVKAGNTEFVFPVGDTSSVNSSAFLYQPVRIFDLGGTTSIEAQYFGNPHPEAGPWYDGSTGANGELEEVGNCDYWEVNKTNPSDPDVRVSFSFFNPSPDYCNSVGDVNTLSIASFNGLEWDPVDPDVGAFTNEIASISVIDTDPAGGTPGSYGAFTFSSSDPANNILPITLLSFHAKAEGQKVRTNWITASEINNDFFTVERSKDGSHWEKAGTVEGAGNSTAEINYEFVDETPYSGISYYRLRQTDFDGTTTLSEPRAVEIRQGSNFGLDRVYRGQDGLNLVYRATAPYVVVEIYDMLGKRIHGELIENYGNGFATIHPDLARGAYVLRLSHGSDMDAEKFVY